MSKRTKWGIVWLTAWSLFWVLLYLYNEPKTPRQEAVYDVTFDNGDRDTLSIKCACDVYDADLRDGTFTIDGQTAAENVRLYILIR